MGSLSITKHTSVLILKFYLLFITLHHSIIEVHFLSRAHWPYTLRHHLWLNQPFSVTFETWLYAYYIKL